MVCKQVKYTKEGTSSHVTAELTPSVGVSSHAPKLPELFLIWAEGDMFT